MCLLAFSEIRTQAESKFSEKLNMNSFQLGLGLVLGFVLVSCVDLKKFDDTENATLSTDEVYKQFPDIRPLWEGKHRDGTLWTNHTLVQLTKIDAGLLTTQPTDANLFCPNYENLDKNQRKYFWAFIISMMVRFESNFDPRLSYQEDFNDSSGNPVISRGLLQISFESSKGYDCGFTSDEQVHDPYLNLSCGINILNRWIPADKSIAGFVGSNWRGGARYWSVLRAAHKESYKTIVEKSSQLSFCRKP